jgi:F-type H+-transporting ATPase subunit b
MTHVLRALPTASLLIAAAPAAARAQEPGLFSINLGLSIWTVVVFLLLVLLLGRFAWGPILGVVEARELRIQKALDESAARHAEALELLEEHKRQLADARRQAGEIVAEGKVAGERLRREIEEKARSEGQAIVESARREIGREKDRALEEIREEAVEIALAAASKLLNERLDGPRDRELVVEYLDGLEAAGPGAEA